MSHNRRVKESLRATATTTTTTTTAIPNTNQKIRNSTKDVVETKSGKKLEFLKIIFWQ